MELKIDTPNIDHSAALREHITSSLEDVLEKYFGNTTSAHVYFRKTNNGFHCAIESHLSKNIELRAESEAGDAYSAFDFTLSKLKKRLRRNKRRIRDNHNQKTYEERFDEAQEAVFLMESHSVDTQDHDDDNEHKDTDEYEAEDSGAIIAETAVKLITTSVADAVMRLDLSDRPALLFKNAGNNRFSMVYKRNDGNIGWVEPSER